MKPSYLEWYADGMSKASWSRLDSRKQWSPLWILVVIALLVLFMRNI